MGARRMAWGALLAALLAVGGDEAWGQRPGAAGVWLGVAGGGVVSSGPRLGAAAAQLVWARQPHYISLRAAYMGNPGEEGVTHDFAEAGALYGRARVRGRTHLAAAAGLALTEVNPCPGAFGACRVAGVPLVAEAAVRPAPVLGIGAQAFANLNAKRPYAGIALLLQLGWMP